MIYRKKINFEGTQSTSEDSKVLGIYRFHYYAFSLRLTRSTGLATLRIDLSATPLWLHQA